jgi:hypothetical protein
MYPGTNIIKPFVSVIYEFSLTYSLRLRWESLPGTNTTLLRKFAIYKLYNIGSRGHIHNVSFSWQLTNGPRKFYIILDWNGLAGKNTPNFINLT